MRNRLEKHAHAREALVALRQANEALTAKNHELLQLNRDNGQWVERHGRLVRELAELRRFSDSQRAEMDGLRLTAAEHDALKQRWAEEVRTLAAVRIELHAVRDELTKEREHREQAEADVLRANVRPEALEQLLTRLKPDQATAADSGPVGTGGAAARSDRNSVFTRHPHDFQREIQICGSFLHVCRLNPALTLPGVSKAHRAGASQPPESRIRRSHQH